MSRLVGGSNSLLLLRPVSARLDAAAPPAQRRALEKQASRACEDELRAALGEGCLVSITHSGGWVIGAGLVGERGAPASHVLGIGIDCEWESRLASLRASEQELCARVVSPEEQAVCGKVLDFLDYWVLKEAAFKSNPANAGTAVPSYRVTHWDPALAEGAVLGPLRGGVCRVACVRTDGLRVGFALCLGPPPAI